MSHRRASVVGALLALAGAGVGAGVAAMPLAPGAQNVPKEYINTKVAPTKRYKKSSRRSSGRRPRKPEPWQFDKRGNARDGRGDFRSAKRLRRQILVRAAGISLSGRQWSRLRKRLRRAQPELLIAHPVHLLGRREVDRLAGRVPRTRERAA